MDSYRSALHIVKSLVEAGHEAYFAGGWVRDRIMGNPSSDIDVATSASPEEIQRLFPKTIPVGEAFGVIVVMLDNRPFEVSTFRKDFGYEDGRHPSRIEPSSAKEDAARRDFTINGMFYDPLSDQILDFVGGQEDIRRQLIRAIGNPEERFWEDRLRMIRAVRFAARFNFRIELKTEEAIKKIADQLFPAVALERVWQELKKMAESGHFDKALLLLDRLGLLRIIFPALPPLDVERQGAVYRRFPRETPPILYMASLFKKADEAELEEICDYLKVSRKEKEIACKLPKCRALSADLQELARFYADPDSTICLHIAAAEREDGNTFLKEHAKRQETLHSHIERIRSGNPVVTSRHLKEEGVQPGKKMGRLLRLAEKIAIEHDLDSPADVLAELKQTPDWSG